MHAIFYCGLKENSYHLQCHTLYFQLDGSWVTNLSRGSNLKLNIQNKLPLLPTLF